MAEYSTSQIIANLLTKLDGVSGGHPDWKARCPAHDDSKPSLSISIGNNGKPLVHCHAGCSQKAVIAALKKLGAWEGKKKKISRSEKVKRHLERIKPRSYEYHDEDGNALYRVTRTGKKFTQEKANGVGGWKKGQGVMKNVRRVPYRLPEFMEKQWVYIVEGEKDADSLWEMGFAATTNSGGAGKWQEEFSEFFEGIHVRIIPDNDAPGESHAMSVAENVLPVAKSVKIIQLNVEKENGDFSDWKAAGGTKKKLRAIAKAAPRLSQDDLDEQPETKPQIVRASEIKPKQRRWIFDPWFQREAVTLMSGDFGAGKTLILYKAIAELSRGFIPMTRSKIKPINTLILAEDNIDDTVIPRLMAAKADLDRVFIMKPPPLMYQDHDAGLKIDIKGLKQIGEWVEEYKVDLLVLDPLIEFTPERMDNNSANQVRTMISNLHQLSQLHGISAASLLHLNKTMQQAALYRTSGSAQFLATAQIGIMVGGDPDDPDKRAAVVMRSKNRKTAAGLSSSFGFNISTTRVTDTSKKAVYDEMVEYAEWTGDSDLTQDRMVEAPKPNKKDQAKKWLKKLLAEGEKKQETIRSLAKNTTNYSWSTVVNASMELGVDKPKKGFGKKGKSWWSLPYTH